MITEPLVGALQNTSLHALLMLVSKGLTRAGFGDVQILDRRQSRQKSRFGGHELQCFTSVGNLPGKVVVKVIRDGIRVRMLDEMAGVIQRTGADLGLIISPFHITRKAKKVVSDYRGTRINVLDGEALAELLKQYEIGIRGKGGVDYAFFGGLEELAERLTQFMRENPV